MKTTSAKRSGMPGEDETCREERAARENPGSTDTPGIIGKRGLSTHAHPQDPKEPLWWTHSRKEQGEEISSHFQVHGTAWSQVEWWEGSVDSRFSKRPFMSTELPEDGVTPGGCWNREELQQEEMDPISSSLMLFSATVTGQKAIPQRQGLISVKRPKELQGNRKSYGRIRGVAFFWVERKGNPWEDMQGTKTHTKETERGENGLVQSPNQVTCWFSPVMCSPDLQAMSTSFSKSVWKTENTEDVVKRGWWRTGKLGKCENLT